MSSGLFNRPYENRSFAAGQLPGTECHAVTQELAAFKVVISFEISKEIIVVVVSVCFLCPSMAFFVP